MEESKGTEEPAEGSSAGRRPLIRRRRTLCQSHYNKTIYISMTKCHLLCFLIILPLFLLQEVCVSLLHYSTAVMSRDMWLMVVV